MDASSDSRFTDHLGKLTGGRRPVQPVIAEIPGWCEDYGDTQATARIGYLSTPN